MVRALHSSVRSPRIRSHHLEWRVAQSCGLGFCSCKWLGGFMLWLHESRCSNDRSLDDTDCNYSRLLEGLR